MKTITLIFALVLSGSAYAQTAQVKDIDASQEGSTTIEITKNKKAITNEKRWEVQDGTADVEGDSAATAKEAKAEWVKKCSEWKKEFREQYKDDKENKVLNTNCGSASCGGEVGQKVCTSKATYKLKTLMN